MTHNISKCKLCGTSVLRDISGYILVPRKGGEKFPALLEDLCETHIYEVFKWFVRKETGQYNPSAKGLRKINNDDVLEWLTVHLRLQSESKIKNGVSGYCEAFSRRPLPRQCLKNAKHKHDGKLLCGQHYDLIKRGCDVKFNKSAARTI